jgi:acyl-CoA hydrolase
MSLTLISPNTENTSRTENSEAQFPEAIQTRIDSSEARVIKAVFPSITNHHNTLFGGEALAWMDETAFIAATRFCRKTLVTVSSDRIDFKKPIPAGTLAELIARVIHVGNTSLKVEVNIYVEDMYQDHREHAIRGVFTFVAVDEQRNPTQVWTYE